MLNDIRLHIHEDDEVQQQQEASSAKLIESNYQSSMRSLAKHVPNLHKELLNIPQSNYALFVNKKAQLNIVNYGTGRTFYGPDPVKEVHDQISCWQQHAVWVNFSQNEDDSVPSFPTALADKLITSETLSKAVEQADVDVLTILGLGLGQHFLPLIKQVKPKHVVLYEPELLFMRSALMAINWQHTLDYCADNNIHLYFRIGQNSSSLFTDINELNEHYPCSNMLVYQHYNGQVFNTVKRHCLTKTWAQLCQLPSLVIDEYRYNDFLPLWTRSADFSRWQDVNKSHSVFKNNLAALEKYFPDLYQKFKDYEVSAWIPVIDQQKNINMLSKSSGAFWYGMQPKEENKQAFANFSQYPNRDGLVLSYKGDKSRHYIHNTFVMKTERLLQLAEDTVGSLPDDVKAVILFGLGAGYQFEELLTKHTVKHLFVCEPNPDFFYASLFALDWANIFEKLEQQDSHLYINIGDDGSNLLSDLMTRIYQIGAYILNETYFYQGYHNDVLSGVIADLREQLRIVISMSEHFDHCLFSIEHTKKLLLSGVPMMCAQPKQKMQEIDLQVPVFIVGNGPSLDSSIAEIKEHQGTSIIVSCGTALQSLYNNNIVPDFHAEIEQFRSTFDWTNRVDALDYLKKITLISCNGIHPDTADLYKDVLLAFKDGESSTRAMTDILGAKYFTHLTTAYPTVSNFAISFFLAAGFQQVYLIGVDLGFIDVNNHHSKQSGYYDQTGKELFDYKLTHNTGITVAGNFTPYVFTKLEFNMARLSMEKAISMHSSDVYNTSNGARISGALPLTTDCILASTSEENKTNSLHHFRTCFINVKAAEFSQQLANTYSNPILLNNINVIVKHAKKRMGSKADIRAFINTCREHLFATYEAHDSLFFFYFHGTLNYLNAALTKALMHRDETRSAELANDILHQWHAALGDIKMRLRYPQNLLDTSGSFAEIREVVLLKRWPKTINIDFYQFDNELTDVMRNAITTLPSNVTINAIFDESNVEHANSLRKYNYSIIAITSSSCVNACLKLLHAMNEQNTDTKIIIAVSTAITQQQLLMLRHFSSLMISVLLTGQVKEKAHIDLAKLRSGDLPIISSANLLLESVKRSLDIEQYTLFIPKIIFCETGAKRARDNKRDEFTSDACELIDQTILPLIDSQYFYDFKTYIGISRVQQKLDKDTPATVLDSLQSRGLLFDRKIQAHQVIAIWHLPELAEPLIAE